MIFRQLFDSVSGTYTYLLASRRGGEALIVDPVIEKALSINDAPVVVEFVVHKDAMVWPMVAAGTSNDEIKVARDMAPKWDGETL